MLERYGIKSAAIHNAHNFVISVLIADIARHFIDPGNFSWSLGLTALIIIGAVAVFKHSSQYCARCANELSASPELKVNSYQWRLYVYHLISNPWFILIALTVSFARSWLPTNIIGQSLWILVQAFICYVYVGIGTHIKYQPWCSYCHHSGGTRRPRVVEYH